MHGLNFKGDRHRPTIKQCHFDTISCESPGPIVYEILLETIRERGIRRGGFKNTAIHSDSRAGQFKYTWPWPRGCVISGCHRSPGKINTSERKSLLKSLVYNDVKIA